MRIRYYHIRGGGDREAKPPRNAMNYFVFLKKQQESKKLKKQAQVQKNIIKYVAQILTCTFLLGIMFFFIFKEVI